MKATSVRTIVVLAAWAASIGASAVLIVSSIELARASGLAAVVATSDGARRLAWNASRGPRGPSRFELRRELATPPCTNPTAGTS